MLVHSKRAGLLVIALPDQFVCVHAFAAPGHCNEKRDTCWSSFPADGQVFLVYDGTRPNGNRFGVSLLRVKFLDTPFMGDCSGIFVTVNVTREIHNMTSVNERSQYRENTLLAGESFPTQVLGQL